MSRPRPITRGEPRPSNTVVLLREAYLVLNDLVVARLAECGHDAVRPAHGAVFQYLDDTGTTVSTLAVRRADRLVAALGQPGDHQIVQHQVGLA